MCKIFGYLQRTENGPGLKELTFTAAVSAVTVFQRVHYTKIGDAGGVPLQPV